MIYLDTNIKSKKQLNYINKLIYELGIADYTADLEIKVVNKCDGGMTGYCYGEEDDVRIEIAMTDESGKINVKDRMKHLAHEMVHAKQLIRGELKSTRRINTTVNGVDFEVDATEWKGEMMYNVPYKDQPWEIEAYSLEDALSEMYI